MNRALSSLRILLVIATGVCTQAAAHTDHDKARFVAENGRDTGDCKNRFRPCASIGYAAQQANKGDTVLVAQGSYEIKEFADLFYLISDVVPALGGYQTLDNYQVQNPQAFPTTLTGIPPEYAALVYEKGFNVIVDTKSSESEAAIKLDKSMAKVNAMYQAQEETACVDGSAGNFPCSNMSLLAHVPLSELPIATSGANDIWGHVDLNTMKEYALLGLRRGLTLIDVTDPVNPIVINAISGQNTTWRDIKVLQYFNHDMNKWEAYAYVTADNASEGLNIINLSNPDEGLVLVRRDLNDVAAHNIYISNVDYGLNIQNSGVAPQAHILGADNFGGSMRSYQLSNPEQPQASYTLAGATRNDYTHDASSLLINDERASRDCVNAGEDGCTVMLDFNELSLRLWDHSNPNSAQALAAVGYPNAQYTHSGWWSENRQYVILHDELDEQRLGLNTTVHIFDISDLNAPTLVSTWVGATRTIDHNGFVRGNKYYMSNYERGVTVLDLSDPLNPTQLGYFDTFPSSSNASFNGAWGVYPFLPSGNILVSDIQGGLYVVKDETQSNEKDDIHFSSTSYAVTEGEIINISVLRSGTQAITVDYQIIRGATNANDINAVESGTLSWDADDTAAKVINIEALDDGEGEGTESMFIRLENVSPNAELLTPNIAKIDIQSLTEPTASIMLTQENITVKETDSSVNITVKRSGSASLAASVRLAIETSAGGNGSAELGSDFSLSTDTLTWAAEELGDKSLSLTIINDNENEGDESFALLLENPENVTISGSPRLQVSIRDDESNQAPIVNTQSSLQVNARQSVVLSASASDPENQSMNFAWQQSAGTSVSLSDADSLSASFTAPNTAGELSFTFTATDDFGVQTSVDVSVTVAEADPIFLPTPITTESSSGGAIWLIHILVLMSLLARLTIKNKA